MHQVQLAEKNIERVKAFKQLDSVPFPLSFVNALCAKPLPCLLWLQIHRPVGLGSSFMIDGISLDAPVLEMLDVDSVFFAVRAPKLRKLTIWGAAGGYDVDAPCSMMLHSLAAMPLLKDLALHNTIPCEMENDDRASTLGEGRTKLLLPHLKRLFLGTDSPFYQFFDVSPGTDVHVECQNAEFDFNLPHLFEATKPRLRVPDYDMLLVFEEEDSDEDEDDREVNIHLCLRSSASLREYNETDNELLDKPEYRLEYFKSSDTEEGTDSLFIVRTLALYIDMKNIKFLDLGGIGLLVNTPIEADELREALSLFPNVTTVQLSADTWNRHLFALSFPGAQETNIRTLPLPALKRILVQDIGDPSRSVKNFERSWKHVIRVMQRRAKNAYPVDSVILCGKARPADDEDSGVTTFRDIDKRHLSRLRRRVRRVYDRRGLEDKDADEWLRGRMHEYVRTPFIDLGIHDRKYDTQFSDDEDS